MTLYNTVAFVKLQLLSDVCVVLLLLVSSFWTHLHEQELAVLQVCDQCECVLVCVCVCVQMLLSPHRVSWSLIASL